MRAVAKGERLMINIDDVDFEPYISSNGEADGLAFQLDRSKRLGTGFHLYKMEPGYTTIPHQHNGNEEFFMISGEAVDNDGTVYRAGDLVLMKDGTEHCSYSKDGCVILVYLEGPETGV
ncbi:MAG: cupin domain-containing protein [Gammaproteobacteria bacterium]|nr:cupin domain-containing protein [Gammaproteobacteria bacterium]